MAFSPNNQCLCKHIVNGHVGKYLFLLDRVHIMVIDSLFLNIKTHFEIILER